MGQVGDETALRFHINEGLMYNKRLYSLIQIMKHHTQYLEPFLRVHNFILRGDGPLSYDVRHYIAIMAAARHRCCYLVNMQKLEFLSCGGKPEWLKGIEHVPKKLQDLNDVNKILAHQPWLINKGHIEKLTKSSDSWSLSEVVHAIVILAHFHVLASFVFGSGLNDEDFIDDSFTKEQLSGNGHINNDVQENETSESKETASSANSKISKSTTTKTKAAAAATTTKKAGKANTPSETKRKDSAQSPVPSSSDAAKDSPPPSPPVDGDGSNVDILLQKMQEISESKLPDADTDESEEVNETKVNVISFERIDNQLTNDINTSNLDPFDSIESELLKYINDSDFSYIDFARRREGVNIQTFRIQDYSWNDQGFSLVNRLYCDVGNLLDEKFKLAYNLTYYNMGKKTNVDTSMFRRAIWNYIQCVYGIRHDDYDYREVNELLYREFKSYIKTLCCFPHRVRKGDCEAIMKEFRRSEKVHVNLMISEARMQAELLYALRAVMKYMT